MILPEKLFTVWTQIPTAESQRRELEKFFDSRASDVPFLTTEDLRDGLGLRELPKEPQQSRGGPPPDFVRFQMLDSLLSGDMGSLSDGPDVDEDAPSVDLPLMKLDKEELEFSLSEERFRLADHKGKRPVVLVFGSFT